MAVPPDLLGGIRDLATQLAADMRYAWAVATRANTWTADQSYASGRIAFTNATANRIDFNVNGLNAPTLSATPNPGTKVLLNPTGSGSATDYAIGMRGNAMWFSMAANNTSHLVEWWGGATRVMYVDGTGALTVAGGVSATNGVTAANYRNTSSIRTSAFTVAATSAAGNLCDATTAAFTITMYSSTAQPGQRFTFIKTDASANAVSFNVSGGGTMSGQTSIVLANRYDWVELESTAVAGVWNVIGRGPGAVGQRLGPYPAAKTANYQVVAATDKFVEVATAAVTVTLPSIAAAPALLTGFDFYVVNASSGAITVSGFIAAETIGNASTAAQTVSLPAGGTLHVACTGVKWRVL